MTMGIGSIIKVRLKGPERRLFFGKWMVSYKHVLVHGPGQCLFDFSPPDQIFVRRVWKRRLDGHVTQDGQLGDAPSDQVEMSAKITPWSLLTHDTDTDLMLVRTSWPAADISAVTAWAALRALRLGPRRPVMSSWRRMSWTQVHCQLSISDSLMLLTWLVRGIMVKPCHTLTLVICNNPMAN